MNTDASTCPTATQQRDTTLPLCALQSGHRNVGQRRQAFNRAGIALSLTLTVALAACGGGGSDGAAAGTPEATQTATSAGSVTGAGARAAVTAGNAATSTQPSVDTTCGNPQLHAQLIAGINALRSSAQSCGSKGSFSAATPLTWNATLFDAAAGHSADMASRNYFNHVSPDGQTLQGRVNAAGYVWSALAENIAAGQTSVANVLSSWMASPGHCVNIMGAAYQEVALSCVRSESGTRYWTLNLGRS
jgi:uncharacterized protein YkwD